MAPNLGMCAVCGEAIEGKRSHALYCSRICSRKAYRMRHPEVIRASGHRHWPKFIRTHKEQRREYNRQYYRDNVELRRAAARERAMERYWQFNAATVRERKLLHEIKTVVKALRNCA